MRPVPAAVFVLLIGLSSASPRAATASLLPSRPLDLPIVIVPLVEPFSFDLIDWRAEQARRQAATPVPAEIEAHSHFGFKQHVGVAAGYDNGVLHGSLGLYMTVAEWGRWNYGIPSPALGFGRYQQYDAFRKRAFSTGASTLFISLASVHYRVGYMPSLGMNWYINLEQIFDLRQNMAGSQVGVSFSTK
jgi:hypothetical protein